MFGIGYQGRSVEGLVATLSAAGVRLLVDVRERAWSQRPAFRKTALAAALANSGIDYLHLKLAGNPFRPRSGEEVPWSVCRRRYSDHLRTRPDVLQAVKGAIETLPAALFCYESDRRMCHRGVLLAKLKRRWDVQHVDL